MSQSDREEYLKDKGYEAPFDESPVEIPDGWRGGTVENTGGNIMCRIWRTWTPGERGNETEFEVIYDVSETATVGIQAYTWDENCDGYLFDHKIKGLTSDEQTDPAMAKLAKKLMAEHTEK